MEMRGSNHWQWEEQWGIGCGIGYGSSHSLPNRWDNQVTAPMIVGYGSSRDP